MTISSTIRKAGPFTGNGITTAFPFAFKVFSTADVLVVQTPPGGTDATLVETVDYTIALNANQDTNPGGTINTTVPLVLNYLLTATSQVAQTQSADIQNAGGFYPQVIEDALDRVTILTQQLLISAARSLRIPLSSTASTDLPPPAANNFLGWNSLGTALVNYAGIASAAVSTFMATVLTAVDAATARGTLGAAGLSGATFTGGINEARGTVAMNATTMALWSQPNTIDGTGAAVTITAIVDAPQAGARRTLYPIAGTTITNSATFAVDGGGNYTTQAGDALEFEAVTVSTYKVHIVKKNGGSSGPNNSPFALRNKFINGDMRIDRRNVGAAQTIVGGASPLAYSLDRWQVRSAGANATVQQVAVNGQNRMQFTGAASVTAVAASQKIEASNCADCAGKNVTFSLKASSSSLVSLTLEAYYANSTDAFGTWGAPTVTAIGTQAVAISGAEQTVSWTVAIPAGATTGLEFRVTGGALLAGQTLTLGDVQSEEGSVATPFERRPYGLELSLCQRYLPSWSGGAGGLGLTTGQAYTTTQAAVPLPYTVTPRITPTGISVSNVAHFQLTQAGGTYTATSNVVFNTATLGALEVVATLGSAVLAAGNATRFCTANAAALILGTGAEL